MKVRFEGFWYCEYKRHVRIHDYFSFLIHNFPIFAFRRYDWDLHGPVQGSTYVMALLGVSILFPPKNKL